MAFIELTALTAQNRQGILQALQSESTPILRTSAEGPPVSLSEVIPGAKQKEAATAVGVITLAGSLQVTVTVTGDTEIYLIPVLLGDNPSDWAIRAATFLDALNDGSPATLFTWSSVGDDLICERLLELDNDTLLNIALANGTCTGVTAAPTSALLVTGFAPVDETVPGHPGRLCRVGDASPYNWYQSDGTAWHKVPLENGPTDGFRFLANPDGGIDLALYDQSTTTYRRVRLNNGALIIID